MDKQTIVEILKKDFTRITFTLVDDEDDITLSKQGTIFNTNSDNFLHIKIEEYQVIQEWWILYEKIIMINTDTSNNDVEKLKNLKDGDKVSIVLRNEDDRVDFDITMIDGVINPIFDVNNPNFVYISHDTEESQDKYIIPYKNITKVTVQEPDKTIMEILNSLENNNKVTIYDVDESNVLYSFKFIKTDEVINPVFIQDGNFLKITDKGDDFIKYHNFLFDEIRVKVEVGN